ncbi:hypothetical protein LTR53_014366 [Teratosphaeriaceae sp. CCFEE 6253]|nr:hypothetical protein LTR53_014366 [Teratosphaeriaceae sp. CCFEE 6253]
MASMTNGSSPSSKFLSHATSYPVVSDSIDAVKNNPYGKKAIEIADGAYQKFGKPVEGYLETPYSYAKPYVAKADELADAGLQRVDGQFPIVKEETSTVVETGKSYVFWPYNYLYGTYSDEYRKTASHNNAGAGLVTLVKAVISTELKIASDFFQVVADFLGPRYQESKKKGSDYIRQGADAADHYKQVGQDKAQQYTQIGQDKAQQYSQLGQDKAQHYAGISQDKFDELTAQGKAKGEQVKGELENGAEQAKGQAKEKTEQAKGQAKETKEEAKARTNAK